MGAYRGAVTLLPPGLGANSGSPDAQRRSIERIRNARHTEWLKRRNARLDRTA
jgi:hypothetical protein